MKLNTINHPKLLRLRRRLSIPTWGAVGLLESLWHLTAQHAKDGAIGKTFTNEDIANAIGWEGCPNNLIEAFVSSGWLDMCESNRLLVHDWHEHCPEFVKGNIRRMKKEFASPSNSVPYSVPYSVPNSVPNSVPYSVPYSVGNLSTQLSGILQDQDQDQANPLPSSLRSEGCDGAVPAPPPTPSEPAIAIVSTKGKHKEWHLLPSHIEGWKEAYKGLDIEAEVRKAIAWLEANPDRRKTSRGMPAFLVNWFNRATDRPGRSGGGFASQPPPRQPTPRVSELIARAAANGFHRQDSLEDRSHG